MADLTLTRSNGSVLTLKYDGQPVLQGIVEFISAVRLGSPSQDDRNLASFIAFEDGRGGIGQWEGDIREDLDKNYWNNGLNVRRFQQAILPLETSIQTMTANSKETLASLHADHVHIIESDISGATRYYVGYGEQVWYSDGSGHTLTKTTSNPGFGSNDAISALLEYILPADGATDSSGDRYLIASSFDNSSLAMAKTPTTGSWTLVNPFSGSCDDMFIFDGKLWLMGQNYLGWTIDPITAASYVQAKGNFPYRWKFVGIFPFGLNNFMPYVLINHHDSSRAQLAILDVDSFRVIPLNLGISGITNARPMGENIGIIHDQGKEISLYSPRNNGLNALDFSARSRHGVAQDIHAVDVELFRGQPLAYVNDGPHTSSTAGRPRRMIHNGVGWHFMDWYGITSSGNAYVHAVPGGRYISHLNDFVCPIRPVSTSDGQILTFYHSDEPYLPGVNYEYEFVYIDGGGLSFYTPWFDFGFADLDGALLAIRCGGFFDSNNLIKVYYQVDSPADFDVWTELGTFPNTGSFTPEIANRGDAVEAENVMLFGGTGDLQGVSFTKARFRFQLIMDDTDAPSTAADEPNQSPNAFPMIVQFLKRPNLRDSLRFSINVADTLGAQTEQYGAFDLAKALRAFYDDPLPVKAEFGEQTTYCMITSFPRVFETMDDGSSQALGTLDGGTFALSLAEPL